jgi:hypothetical protein
MAVVAMILNGIVVWRALLVGGGLILVNTLPYGDRTPWLWRPVVFASYVLPAGILAWQTLLVSLPVTVIGLVVLFMLSRTVTWMTWKVWEAQAGLLQAAALIFGVLAYV